MSSDEEDLAYHQNHCNCNRTLLTQDRVSRQLVKSSAASGKINVLTTSRTTTHRHSDKLRNMFFKNIPDKLAFLKNYNESQRTQKQGGDRSTRS